KLSRNGIARIDNALTIRANAFCNAGSVGIGSRNKSGITIRKNSITKKTVSNASAINPHGAGRERGGWPSDSSSNANLSASGDFAPEHVRRHVHQHGSHRWMVRRNLGE